jgi:hypothetical protein
MSDETPAKFKEFIAEPAQEPGEEFDQAFDELMRLKAIEQRIEELRHLSSESKYPKIGILEREVKAIRDWINHKRETPTTNNPLLVDYNLNSVSHSPTTDTAGDDTYILTRKEVAARLRLTTESALNYRIDMYNQHALSSGLEQIVPKQIGKKHYYTEAHANTLLAFHKNKKKSRKKNKPTKQQKI